MLKASPPASGSAAEAAAIDEAAPLPTPDNSEQISSDRVCTFSDGPEATMLLASYLLELPPQVSRENYPLAEALTLLKESHGVTYDEIIVAPMHDRAVRHHHLNAVLAAAAPLCRKLILLCPKDARPDVLGQTNLHLLEGPPFTRPIDMPPTGENSPETRTWQARISPLVKRFFTGRATLPPVAETGVHLPLTPEVTPAPPQKGVIVIQPLAGGAGGSLLTVNLAYEIARHAPKLRLCILDLNLQFGSVATYMNLPAGRRIADAYRHLTTFDAEAFQACLQPVDEQIVVFAAPDEILPYDALKASDLRKILGFAQATADLVLIDMPHVITDWSGVAYSQADRILAVALLDVRSARNDARLRDLLQGANIALHKLTHVINRLPARPSKETILEIESFSAGLTSAAFHRIPEGGPAVTEACNIGRPLWRDARRNPARLAVKSLASQLAAKVPRDARSSAGSRHV